MRTSIIPTISIALAALLVGGSIIDCDSIALTRKDNGVFPIVPIDCCKAGECSCNQILVGH